MWKKLEHKFILPCRRFSKFIIPAVVYLLAYSFKEWLFSTVPSSFDEEPFQSSEEADWRTWKRTQRAGWWCSSSFEQEAPRTSFQGVLRGWLLSESAAYDVNAFPAFTCRFWWYWIPLWMPLLNGICSFLPCSLEIGERERERHSPTTFLFLLALTSSSWNSLNLLLSALLSSRLPGLLQIVLVCFSEIHPRSTLRKQGKKKKRSLLQLIWTNKKYR